MKRLAIILFIVGLLFEAAAFFGDQAANIPFVMRLVAPEYSQAQQGIQMLSTKKTLKPEDAGFSVISDIFLSTLRQENAPSHVGMISIQEFTHGGARLEFGENRAREVIPINVALSNGQMLEWNFASLREEVDALQNQNLFGYAVVVFFLGVVIQCCGFIVEHRKGRRAKPIEEP